MTVEIHGEERGVYNHDRDRGFRIEVHWSSDEGDSETGEYYIETWLSPYIDRPDGEHISGRRDVTHDRIEEAIEGILDEKAQDDAVFEYAEVLEITMIRKVGSLM